MIIPKSAPPGSGVSRDLMLETVAFAHAWCPQATIFINDDEEFIDIIRSLRKGRRSAMEELRAVEGL